MHPLLVTVDVEIAHDRDLGAQERALWRLHEAMAHTPATWFCTADAAERFRAPLRALAAAGHTIGCHGLDHQAWEDYRRLEADAAAGALAEATRRIEAVLGTRPRVFRGPRMTTSATTQAVLRRLGYQADFSVCAWRWDATTAGAFDRRWVSCAPRPYRPALDDAFARVGPPRRGDLSVVPLMGFGLPLCSGTLFLAGGAATLALARAGAALAGAPDTPVVYLFHSYESCAVTRPDRRPRHHRLYPADPERRHRANLRFIERLRGCFGEPMNAATYLRKVLLHEPVRAHTHGPDDLARDSPRRA